MEKKAHMVYVKRAEQHKGGALRPAAGSSTPSKVAEVAIVKLK